MLELLLRYFSFIELILVFLIIIFLLVRISGGEFNCVGELGLLVSVLLVSWLLPLLLHLLLP